MDHIYSFQDLAVWKKAHKLALKVYKATENLPKDDRSGLVSQTRRLAVSIPESIAEGFKERRKAGKAGHYTIARDSMEELRYYFIMLRDLGYMTGSGGYMAELDEVGRMLDGLVKGGGDDKPLRC